MCSHPAWGGNNAVTCLGVGGVAGHQFLMYHFCGDDGSGAEFHHGVGANPSSLHSSTYSYQTPTGLPESYWTGLGLGQISCWLITIQILSPSPSGVLVNSYWNDPKSQGMGIVESSTRSPVGISEYKESSRNFGHQ